MYYTNLETEEFDNYLAFLDLPRTQRLEEATHIFIDLEKYIFQGFPQYSFVNHGFDVKELINRFSTLVELLDQRAEQYVHRVLMVNLVDVKSTVDEDLFWWSFYNHKYAASKGKDQEALDKWSEWENKIGIDRVSGYKALREANLALFLEVVKRHPFFDSIVFGGIDEEQKNEVKFGLDIAEEQYITRTIEEYNGASVCKIVQKPNASILVNLMRHLLQVKGLKHVKGHIVSNSEKVDNKFLKHVREVFLHAGLEEVPIKDTDFVLLINDLDLLSNLPFIDTEKPIFVVDLSSINSLNFGYLLLKDEGFAQVYSYAKHRENEKNNNVMVRSLCAGLLYFMARTSFTEQIAINYIDDFFAPLAKSMGKTLKDFSGPIDLLVHQLEKQS